MYSRSIQRTVATLVFIAATSATAFAQSSAVTLPQAPVLTLEASQVIMQAAQAEASKNGASSIAIVDVTGAPVLLSRMDGAVPASAGIALGKAETAVSFRASTKTVEDGVNGPRPALLSSGYVTMQGGLPITVAGTVVGAIGVSGGTKDQDEAVAAAGIAELAK